LVVSDFRQESRFIADVDWFRFEKHSAKRRETTSYLLFSWATEGLLSPGYAHLNRGAY
jgi:hypothetical protein